MDLGAASIYLITDDPDTLHDRAVTAGAEIVRELRDEDYGSRGFSARDPEGHYWHFGTYRPAPDGLTKRRRATTVDPVFFPSPEELREWFERHHADEPQLLVGYWKRATGKPSITWPESVDQALCFGWIDGIRRRIDDDSYSIRFTPRRPRSIWSAVNVARMRGLIELGLATPPGLAAFEARREEQTAIYSYEQSGGEGLDEDRRRRFEHADEAWAWFSAQPPGYRRTAAHWVMSAKREETRERRFAALVADSAAGRRIGPLRRQG